MRRPIARGLYARRVTLSKWQHSARPISKVRHSRLQHHRTRSHWHCKAPAMIEAASPMTNRLAPHITLPLAYKTNRKEASPVYAACHRLIYFLRVSPVSILQGCYLGDSLHCLCCRKVTAQRLSDSVSCLMMAQYIRH